MPISPNLQDLSEAIEILTQAERELVRGPLFPYSVVVHAKRYLNSQIEAYFTEAA